MATVPEDMVIVNWCIPKLEEPENLTNVTNSQKV